ncbi:MAG: HAD family phosphatase [Clostridia bacterium]|nr:HAD family phosphatase [Clostridia bacterium]
MTLRGILFDFNGTLFFDSDIHIHLFQEYHQEYGKEIPSADFIVSHIFGRDNATILRQNFKPDATDKEAEAFSQAKEERYRDFCLAHPDRLRLTDGAEEMLNHLKACGIPFALATGSEWDNVVFYREQLGLGRWFTSENTVYIDGTFPGKPAPDIYQIAAARLGLSPSECLVFEDGTSGILAANRAGAGAVVALYENGLPSPINEHTRVNGVQHNFTEWRALLADYGLTR